MKLLMLIFYHSFMQFTSVQKIKARFKIREMYFSRFYADIISLGLIRNDVWGLDEEWYEHMY